MIPAIQIKTKKEQSVTQHLLMTPIRGRFLEEVGG